MTGSELVTASSEIRLVPIDSERDAPLGVQWLKGESGRDTLQKMGVTDEYNHESTLQAERERLQKILDDKQELAWMIQRNGQVVGITEIHLDEFEGLASPSIHIMIGDPASRGQGIGTVVFSAVINYLQRVLGHTVIHSRHLTNNTGSAALLIKLGFVNDGEVYQDDDGLKWQNVILNLTSDQQALWNRKHAAGELAFGREATDFAHDICGQLKATDRLLELGCGEGGDAELFAPHVAHVTATDFSDVIIAKNIPCGNAKLTFQRLDCTKPFPTPAESFDVVYSHLALHYWNEEMTAKIFAEIARILKPGGRLFFRCKSNKDPNYGVGDEVEPGVFSKNGHLRHFFSLDYTRQLVSDQFILNKLDESAADYAGTHSEFINCWAEKK